MSTALFLVPEDEIDHNVNFEGLSQLTISLNEGLVDGFQNGPALGHVQAMCGVTGVLQTN